MSQTTKWARRKWESANEGQQSHYHVHLPNLYLVVLGYNELPWYFLEMSYMNFLKTTKMLKNYKTEIIKQV